MAPARSLHEIITGLTGDAGTSDDLAAVLRDGGYPDLPQDLFAEAVVSFADTAPAEIAAHLAPFVMAHGPVAPDDGAAGDIGQLVGLLAAARTAGPDLGPVLEMSEIDPPAGTGDAADLLDEQSHTVVDEHAGPWSAPTDTAFGHGAGPARTEPADDAALDAAAPEDVTAGYGAAQQPPAQEDLAVPDGDLWAALPLSDAAPATDDIDDIDDIDG